MYSDDWTEVQLAKLERKIKRVYAQANKELQEKADDYFSKFQKRYEKEYAKYLEGKYTDEEFKQWVKNQIGRGERWLALRDTMAQRLTDANLTASAYINDTTPQIYSLNYNYEAYLIEGVHPQVSFTMLNEQAVRSLVMGEDPFPKVSINVPIDKRWNKKKLQNALLQGILQGESISEIATRFEAVTSMNRNSAIRNARTAVTGAQNGGRMKSYESASRMGIKIEKMWRSINDARTRESHSMLNGERRPYDEPFSNGLMYPGDPKGTPTELYNCRCTMISIDALFSKPEITFEQWGAKHGNYIE